MHPEHPLELVQVQRSAGTLNDEDPVQVLDAVQLQLVLLGLRLLTLAHSGYPNVMQFSGVTIKKLKIKKENLFHILRPPTVLHPPHGLKFPALLRSLQSNSTSTLFLAF